jgi:hypothetical protein
VEITSIIIAQTSAALVPSHHPQSASSHPATSTDVHSQLNLHPGVSIRIQFQQRGAAHLTLPGS